MRHTNGTKELIWRYYGDLVSKTTWRDLLAEDFLLTGTVVKETRGRDLYVGNGFFKLVRGHRVKETLVEGNGAFALVEYDLLSPSGKTTKCDVAEFWKARDGRLTSVAIYFDTASFGRFLSQ